MSFTLLLVLGGCFSGPTPSAEENLETNIQFLIEQGEDHWEKRVDPVEAETARLFLSKAHQLAPADLGLTALYARTCQFIGHYIEQDPESKDILFKEGLDAAWKILIQASSFQEAYNNTEGDTTLKYIAGLEALPKSYVPVMYWWVGNYSRYLVTKPVIERINNRDIIETVLHRILALEPNYFYGGAFRIFGGVFARIPGLKLSQSAAYFDQAIQANPHYLGTYVLRAEYLHTKAGDREQFVRDLEFVIQADPTGLPDVMPENLLEQEKAKNLLSQASILFE